MLYHEEILRKIFPVPKLKTRLSRRKVGALLRKENVSLFLKKKEYVVGLSFNLFF
jgi:hypothetical protein